MQSLCPGFLVDGETWDVPATGNEPALLVIYGTPDDDFDYSEQAWLCAKYLAACPVNLH